MVFFFFFSSRRRHTRLVSDWSSDVCSSDVEMFMCLGKVVSFPEEHCQVVFDTGLVTYMARLLEVITCGCVFNQGTVNVIFAVFCGTQILQDSGELTMETASE